LVLRFTIIQTPQSSRVKSSQIKVSQTSQLISSGQKVSSSTRSQVHVQKHVYIRFGCHSPDRRVCVPCPLCNKRRFWKRKEKKKNSNRRLLTPAAKGQSWELGHLLFWFKPNASGYTAAGACQAHLRIWHRSKGKSSYCRNSFGRLTPCATWGRPKEWWPCLTCIEAFIFQHPCPAFSENQTVHDCCSSRYSRKGSHANLEQG